MPASKKHTRYGENLRVLLIVEPEAKCEKDPSPPPGPHVPADRHAQKDYGNQTLPGYTTWQVCGQEEEEEGLGRPSSPRSFLVFLLFLLVLLGGLGGQGPHSVADGLIVGVHPRQVFQNALEEFRILHDDIVVFFLREGGRGRMSQ